MAAVEYQPQGTPPALGNLVGDDAAAIVNDVEFAYFSRRIYVGVAGDVSLVTKAGTTLLYKNCVAGSYIGCRAKKVNASGTTATNLIAEW